MSTYDSKAKLWQGYLRTGQILQLMQKNDMALGIYSYGMKNVPVGNEDFKLLRGMYDKLATKCSPPKAVDPLMVLPTELVELVFQYLNLQNLVNLLRVSKQWKSLLESMPKLWRNLDLSTAKRTVSFQAIKACVLRSRGSATHATVGKWLRNGKTKESLIYITSRCRGLEYLKIQGIGFNEFLFKGVTMPNSLKSLILSPHVEVSLGYVCKSLNSLHCLARAEFHQILAEGSAQWTRDLSQLRILVLNAARPFDTPRDIRLVHTLICNPLHGLSADISRRISSREFHIYRNYQSEHGKAKHLVVVSQPPNFPV